jgi:hypothetical protein
VPQYKQKITLLVKKKKIKDQEHVVDILSPKRILVMKQHWVKPALSQAAKPSISLPISSVAAA